jgi:hypothetical protein
MPFPKNNLVVSFFIFLSLPVLAQNNDVSWVCGYTSHKINEKAICDLLGFQTRPAAQKAVEEIVKRSGLKQNFYVMECPSIDNCFAATRNGERLIIYDSGFMRRVNSLAQTDWGAMSILAHEIGHHLQGHTLKQGGSDPGRELEADEFSGFVMYQMGATLQEAQSAISKMTTDFDSGTHPPKSQRLNAIQKGYNSAAELYPRIVIPQSKAIETKPQQNLLIKNDNDMPEKILKTGCIEGNCKEGYGIAINRNTREKYTGNWENGVRSGYGVEYYNDGTKKYEGDFAAGTYQGYGTLFFKNGDKYTGKFKRGTMHDDNAAYYYRNGDRLFVTYTNGKREGRGKIILAGGKAANVFFENDRLQ